jgi:anti-sigma factor RsiW
MNGNKEKDLQDCLDGEIDALATEEFERFLREGS